MLITEVTLYYPELDDRLEGLSILQVSDLHTNGWGAREEILFHLLRRPAPGRDRCCDVLIISGDMCHQLRLGNPFQEKSSEDKPLPVGISRHGIVFPPHWQEGLVVTERLLDGFSCPMGVFLIQGNHDSPDYMQKLNSRQVTVLNNQSVPVTTPGGGGMLICGLRGYGRSASDMITALADHPNRAFTLAVSHFPEFSGPLHALGARLILAGHTHGGQVCLPGRKAIITHSRTGQDFVSGLTRLDNGYAYTSRGIGASMFPVRLNCPQEVSRFTLRRGPREKSGLTESAA